MTDLEYDLEKALETTNLELLNLKSSREYIMGKKVIDFMNNLKAFRIGTMIQGLKTKHKEKKLRKKYGVHQIRENLAVDEWKNNLLHNSGQYKVAVYTAILGGYDKLADPLIINEGFDYFVFTDSEIKSNIWKKRDLPAAALEFKNNTLANRYLKLHPHDLFPEYDFAVYIDGNVTIVSDIYPIIHLADNNVGIAMHNHVLRNCIYEEADMCVLYGKGDKNKLLEQCKHYREIGFPEHYGMLEATIIISKMNSASAKNVLSEWWKEFLDSGSKRDQIALPYILWKLKIKPKEVGVLGNNVYRNPKFRIISH